MSTTPECKHDWQGYESICTYSNGDKQRAYTCKLCDQNRITINGTEISESEAQSIIDRVESGELTETWSIEGDDRQWTIPLNISL